MSQETESVYEIVTRWRKMMATDFPLMAAALEDDYQEITDALRVIDRRESDWQRDVTESEDVIEHFGLFDHGSPE